MVRTRYNAGHLIEAALAHKHYYQNDLLIQPILRYVGLIHSLFGPGKEQRHGYPGHPEIELALLRLFSATGNAEAYDLAQYFITERGNPTGQDGLHFYDWESKQRGDSLWLRPNAYPESGSHWYNQAHAPLLQQKSVEGHAVRAMYLLVAVADLLCLDKSGTRSHPQQPEWLAVLDGLWRNMVDKKMYATGGIGATKQWEGFGIDYFLPQGTDEGGCYAETCAAIGVMMLAERLLELNLDGRYADVMELCLYNGVMTAMSLDGKSFTYVNQLASSPSDKSHREDWFWCACCPPNLMRLFGSLAGYLWDFGEDDGGIFVNVHLYTTAKVTFPAQGQAITLQQKSNWPWEGNILFELGGLSSSIGITIRLRIPEWAGGEFTVRAYHFSPYACFRENRLTMQKLTPSFPSARLEKGYITLPPSYTSDNPAFAIQIGGFLPRYIAPHPYTNQHTLTIARGPIIYCLEDQDNPWEVNHFKNVMISAESKITEEQRVFGPAAESYVALHSVGWQRRVDGPPEESLCSAGQALREKSEIGGQISLTFIPYYFRANREGRGQMRVGLLRK